MCGTDTALQQAACMQECALAACGRRHAGADRVAERSMHAVSESSTRKVDWPSMMWSLAPMRTNTASTGDSDTHSAGIQAPTCARMVAMQTCTGTQRVSPAAADAAGTPHFAHTALAPHLPHERGLAAGVGAREQHERRLCGAKVHVVGHKRARAGEADVCRVPQRGRLEERALCTAARVVERDARPTHRAARLPRCRRRRKRQKRVQLPCRAAHLYSQRCVTAAGAQGCRIQGCRATPAPVATRSACPRWSWPQSG
jgi:hypothetical protein